MAVSRKRRKLLLGAGLLAGIVALVAWVAQSATREAVVARVNALGGQVTRKPTLIREQLRRLGWTREFGQIASIGLSSSKVSDADLELIGTLHELEGLSLMNSAITDSGLTHLRGLENLQTLILTRTQITGEGFRALDRLDRLKVLRLMHTNVSDKNLRFIAQLEAIEELDLTMTPISAVGLRQLRPLTRLKDLHISGTSVTLDTFLEIDDIGRTEIKYRQRMMTSVFMADENPTESRLAAARARFPHVDLQVLPLRGDGIVSE